MSVTLICVGKAKNPRKAGLVSRAGDGSNFRLPADMVITSLGQSRLIACLQQCRGVKLENQRVAINRETGEAANPKYFAGGDCVSGGPAPVDSCRRLHADRE